MIFYAITNTGRIRLNNQDYVFASDADTGALSNLFIVADGMGGHQAGEYASETAVRTVLEEIRSKNILEPIPAIDSAIKFANKKIYNEAQADASKAGMGTTFVAATVFDEHLYIANVGDSRLYVVEDEGLRQVTRDHSVVEELVRNGGLTREAARKHVDKHKITRAVGAEKNVKIDFFDVPIEDVHQILMCTDGLTNMLSDEEIEEILLSDQKVKQKAEQLVEKANENGGKDNITVVVIDSFTDEV
ncbi:MAG: Stp1/IreP family PP2C-type Ser/Thr phosphatase [Lachnospiraceae bacterium]|nr:Stp1/IreP family PP2C-type Ser/Thr phosphatase [Lachnospiraceae bacterium]